MFLPVGNDFGFRNAPKNFKNLDKLINYYNAHTELNVTAFYSTPKLFFEMFLEGLKNPEILKTKHDDFFPHKETGIWTGYFSSR